MDKFIFEDIEVTLQRRMFQRSINLLLKPCGEVKVTAGKTTSQRSIIVFLNSQKNWLLKNFKVIQEQKKQFPDIQYINDEIVLFIGKKIRLQFIYKNLKRIKCELSYDAIKVFLSPTHAQGDISKAIKQFYKKSGVEILNKIVGEQSRKMNLYPKKLSYRAQKTRWGSCSSLGAISLNWKLILCPPEVIEYVVIHELAHLKHQDHSKKFWSLVAKYSPQYKQHTIWLKQHNYEIEKYKLGLMA